MILLQGFQDIGLFVLRLFLGFVFFYHSIPKLKMPKQMAKAMGSSASRLVILGLVEFFSALALIFGIYAEIGALLVGTVMIGALYHKIFVWKAPFSAMDKTGWEFDLILLGAAVAILTLGAGAISLDAVLGIYP